MRDRGWYGKKKMPPVVYLIYYWCNSCWYTLHKLMPFFTDLPVPCPASIFSWSKALLNLSHIKMIDSNKVHIRTFGLCIARCTHPAKPRMVVHSFIQWGQDNTSQPRCLETEITHPPIARKHLLDHQLQLKRATNTAGQSSSRWSNDQVHIQCAH